jgi:hypothetical protein
MENKIEYTIDSGCSRWTNASRGMARHIKRDNQFLCGKVYRGGHLGLNEPFVLDNVTCEKCKRIYNKLTSN